MNDPSIVESIFLAALEKATAEARSAYLDDACKDNPGLRHQVNRLLAAHPKAVEFLEQPAVPDGDKTAAHVPAGEQTGVYVAAGEQPGSIVAGRYKLLEMIGEGGMGEVWVADQLEPIRRRVALKLIKPGMDSRTVLARFEAERQALALMDHPNIAKVFDGGATADQRPYFVMELVKGTPITTFCDARKLSPRERLELFVPICQAIQHAHTKGIIHRDIKPSNVLVALHDERPVPKVIDFGVSKAVGQQLTEMTIYTGFGALVGTPAYMAPEQATFNQLDIDTRADVYALGVLLYELLAGSPPMEPERMKKAALDEVLRLVREEEPPRPSQRLSTSESKASIAAGRQTDPAKLTKLIQGELDWIVMKALEKDRNRRYETANGFAADVQRYLAGEQVQAVPPSTAYRLRKFVGKNRVVLTTAVAFAGLLIVSAAVSGWLAVQARRAEAVAEDKRKEAEANAETAKTYSGLFQEASNGNLAARIDAEIKSLSLQVDVDLMELSEEPRIGLLRLAKPMPVMSCKNITVHADLPIKTETVTLYQDNPAYRQLREFVTAAVLVSGQQYAPLLPPITHDGQEVTRYIVSPDGRRLLTIGEDATARLWDTWTAKPIAILRREGERVANGGFSTDGKTIFTDDTTSVARFWDATTGTFRAATDARPSRYTPLKGKESPWKPGEKGNEYFVWQDQQRSALCVGNRLMTQRAVGELSRNESWNSVWDPKVELWDTETGRFICRLDAPGRNINRFQFLGDGRWIKAEEGNSIAVILSSEDGRLLARLGHEKDPCTLVKASPTGQRIAAVFALPMRNIKNETICPIRIWDARTWQEEPLSMTYNQPNGMGSTWFEWLTDETFIMGDTDNSSNNALYIVNQDKPVIESLSGKRFFETNKSGNMARFEEGRIIDLGSGQRLRPPGGRRYHPALADFVGKQRFIDDFIHSTTCLLDTRTEKHIPYPNEMSTHQLYHLPELGLVIEDNWNVHFIPTLHLDIPADMLQLWAQLAVRGELSSDGEFIKWSEEHWETKRQELAAVKPPYPDVPFPGYVATDRLHWLRSEYFAATNDGDKQRLAKELLRRAEENRDRSEAVRWKTILKQ